MIFKASLDKMAKLTTVSITIIFLGLIVLPLLETGMRMIGLFFSITGLVLYLMLLGLSPIHYKVTEDTLIIRRLFKNVVILKQDIISAYPIDPEEMESITRMFGAAGIYGYYGLFSNATLGKMTWYATRMDLPILIMTRQEQKILITPNRQEDFLIALFAHQLSAEQNKLHE